MLHFKQFDPLNEEEMYEGTVDTCPEIEEIFKRSPHVRTVIIETRCDRIMQPDTPFGYTYVYTPEEE